MFSSTHKIIPLQTPDMRMCAGRRDVRVLAPGEVPRVPLRGLPVSFAPPAGRERMPTRRVAAGEGRVKTLVTQLMSDAGAALPEAGR